MTSHHTASTGMTTTRLEFLGVRLDLHCDTTELAEFISWFNPWLITEKEAGEPEITIEYRRDAGIKGGGGFSRISRTLQVSDNRFIIHSFERMPGLRMAGRFDDGVLSLKASRTEKPAGLRALFTGKKRVQQHHQTILMIFHLVYLPCMYFLERHHGLFPVHGGAVKIEDTGIIFTGLGGVGKTTVSVGALGIPRSRFVSDTMLFTDGREIRSLKNPLALGKRSLDLLGGIRQHLTPLPAVSHEDRIYHHLDPELYCHRCRPHLLFSIRSGLMNRVDKLDPETMRQRILSSHLVTGHMREYLVFSSLLDLVPRNPLLQGRDESRLKDLVHVVKCYDLQFKYDSDLNDLYRETILRVARE